MGPNGTKWVQPGSGSGNDLMSVHLLPPSAERETQTGIIFPPDWPGFRSHPEQITTKSPFPARPAATFIRTVSGSLGAGFARFSQNAPSRLTQQSMSPGRRLWLG